MKLAFFGAADAVVLSHAHLQKEDARRAKLIEGAREVKIFGEYVAVKAQVSPLGWQVRVPEQGSTASV